MSQYGTFQRYTITKHKDVVDAFPELAGTIIRDSYAEAEKFAWEIVLQVLKQNLAQLGYPPIKFIVNLHGSSSVPNDPFDVIGSIGWKTIE